MRCRGQGRPENSLSPEQITRWRALEAKIRSCAELLVHQGTVASRLARGRRVWSLRFYEMTSSGKVQRAIYLGGDDFLLQRTQELLNEFREDQRKQAEVEVFRQLSGKLVGIVRLR